MKCVFKNQNNDKMSAYRVSYAIKTCKTTNHHVEHGAVFPLVFGKRVLADNSPFVINQVWKWRLHVFRKWGKLELIYWLAWDRHPGAGALESKAMRLVRRKNRVERESERASERERIDLGSAVVALHKLAFSFDDYTPRGGAWST